MICVTLNLTINNSVATNDSITACDSTTWNGTTYTTSGVYTQTLQTINGCDSVVTMDITIHPSPVFTFPQDTLAACNVDSILVDAGAGYNFYAWSNGSNTQQIYAANSGTYSVSVTDANGCTDSDDVLVDILNVDIVQNDTTICEGDSVEIECSILVQMVHGPSDLGGSLNNGLLLVINGIYVEMQMMKVVMEIMEL